MTENTETITNPEDPAVKARSKKMLLYIGIFSIVMLFGGLTSAYIVSQADSFWVSIKMPVGFYISTAVLLASSGTMWLAIKQARSNANPTAMVALTLVLGIAFGVLQFQSWNQLTETGNYLIGNHMDLQGEYGEDYTFILKGEELVEADGEFYLPSDQLRENPLKDKVLGARNTASSYIYILSAVHLLHLVGGLIYLMVVLRGSAKGRYSSGNYLRLELCGTYWHFLDGLWLYLFLFLLFIH